MLALTLSATAGAQVAARPQGGVATLAAAVARANGDVIIGFKPAAGTAGLSSQGARLLSQAQVSTLASTLASAGVKVTRQYGIIPAVAATIPADALDGLLRNPNVQYVAPVQVYSLSPSALDAAPPVAGPSSTPVAEVVPWGVEKIRAPVAWGLGGTTNTGQGVKVGIMDSGGDPTHPDLVYAGGKNFKTGGTATSDWSDNIATCDGHGTHVAGTVAARRNNGIGVVGVAPDVSLYALKISELARDGSGGCAIYDDVWLAALDWAVTNGMRVVNMSFGGGGFSQPTADAIAAAANAGLVMVVAAGNSNAPVAYPAAYPGAIAVSAVDQYDARASFSNYGPTVEVGAPGVSILSTVPTTIDASGYQSKDGTSMAAPHVTGLVALLVKKTPTLTPTTVKTALRAGALDFGAAGKDDAYGYGRIDAVASLGGGSPVIALAPNSQLASLGGTQSSSRYYVVTVPSSVTDVTIATSGGTGDVDLLVRRGVLPSASVGNYDCAPLRQGNVESCGWASPTPGNYYVQLTGYQAYSGVTLSVSMTAPAVATGLGVTTQPAGAVSGAPFTTQPVVQVQDIIGGKITQAGVVVTASVATGPGVLRGTLTATTDATGRATFTNLLVVGAGTHTLSFTANGLTAATSQSLVVTQPSPVALTSGAAISSLTMGAGTARYFAIDPGSVPAALQVATAGTSGNLNLYVSYAKPPTLTSYDCRSINAGSAESCSIASVKAGTYYVMLYAGSAVAGGSVTATVTLPTIGIRLAAATPTKVVPGTQLSIPVLVDMSQAMGLDLASLTFDASWDPTKLGFVSVTAGAFGSLTLNSGTPGALRAGLYSATGKTTSFTAATLVLKAGSARGTARVGLSVTGAGTGAGASVLPRVVVTPLDVCVAGGKYGDANGDGVVDVIDAQQIARYAIGLSVLDAVRLAEAGDVTADNLVNILDAQQIARKTASLSAAARIGQAIPDPPCP